jgi:hypothetical protein
MGRRWWQKEARANAEKERRISAQAATQTDEIVNIAPHAAEEIEHHDTHDVVNNIADAVDTLAQVVEDAIPDVQENVEDESFEQQDEDVQVPGITIAQAVNSSFNSNKKKRRR